MSESVLEHLYRHPYAYDFFQAVRLLGTEQARPGIGVGALTTVVPVTPDEPVRFRTWLSLETPASSIYSLTRDASTRLPVMTVTFLGLTGPSGTLPVRYTEMLQERRARYRDQTAHQFFDLFSHRLTTLFYRAWQKHHVTVDHERGRRDGFQRQVMSLVGLGTRGLTDRLRDAGVDDQLFAYYAGRFAERARTVEGLTAILSEQFAVTVEIEPFRGRWLRLEDALCTQLGVANCRLGEHPMLGRQTWDSQSRFRIRLGPLSRRRFDDFLPTGKAYRALVRLVRFCVGHTLEFDVQPVLDRRQVPPCVLGGPAASGTRLGWTTWLGRPTDAPSDASDVVLPDRVPAWAA